MREQLKEQLLKRIPIDDSMVEIYEELNAGIYDDAAIERMLSILSMFDKPTSN